MFGRLRHSIILFTLLVLIIPSGGSSVAQEDYVPRFESAPCAVSFPSQYRADCGYLIVPAKRSESSGETVTVAVAILRSPNREPQPDPVVFIVGGPGSHNLQHIAANGLGRMLESWLRNRNVILVDQRGVGLSEPALTCPEYDQLDLSGLSQKDAEAKALETLETCADTLTARGIDLTAFNTLENADDLADLPMVLGLGQVNYYGLSYGANVILEVIQRHPERVRSAILEAVSPPDGDVVTAFAASFEHALREVIATCNSDSDCRAPFPDFEAVMFGLIQQLDEEPANLNVENPQTHEVVEGTITGDSIISAINSELRYPANVKFFPQWTYALAAQHYEVFIPNMQRDLVAVRVNGDDTGAFYSYRCSDYVKGQSQEAVEAALSGIHPVLQGYFRSDVIWQQQACAVWPVEPVAPEAHEPVVSDIPVLMFSGRYDPVTPASFADHVLETLPNGYHFVFPKMGHGVAAMGNYCAVAMSAAFLETPTTAPDSSCIERESPMRFVISGQ